MSNRYKGKSYYKKASYAGEKARGNSLHKNGGFALEWSKGGGFAEYAEKIDRLGGDLKAIFTQALETAFEIVQADTLAALDDSNLPAKGRYSHGQTVASVLDDNTVKWSGSVAEIGVGFDKTKPGAGGWLITGTPKMQPDEALASIYDRKGYTKHLQWQIEQIFIQEVKRLMGG